MLEVVLPSLLNSNVTLMDRPDSTTEKKTLILVDRTLPSGKRARDCLWNQLIPSAQQKSISDERDNRESVRINEFDLVVVNWDAANGDIVTGSDDTMFYFMTRGEDRREALLQNGGILLCEFQDGKSRLHQSAYDAIFGKSEIEVMRADLAQDETLWFGPTVKVVSKFRNHPIVRGLPTVLSTHYQEDGSALFNFAADVRSMYGYKHRSSLLWLGWFQWWRKGWIPLLVADLPNDHPQRRRWFCPRPAVLLAKCQGNGLYLASTLWIAISRSKELADGICSADLYQIKKYHNRVKWLRILRDVAFPMAFLILLWETHAPLLEGVRNLAPLFAPATPFLRQLIEDFGKTWVFILALLFYLRWVWDRPYGINLFQSFRPALRNLKSFFGN